MDRAGTCPAECSTRSWPRPAWRPSATSRSGWPTIPTASRTSCCRSARSARSASGTTSTSSTRSAGRGTCAATIGEHALRRRAAPDVRRAADARRRHRGDAAPRPRRDARPGRVRRSALGPDAPGRRRAARRRGARALGAGAGPVSAAMRYVLAALAGFAVGVWTAYAVFSLSYGRALAVLPAVAVAVIAVIWMLGAITASLAALRARRAAAARRAPHYETRGPRRADASSSTAPLPTPA